MPELPCIEPDWYQLTRGGTGVLTTPFCINCLFSIQTGIQAGSCPLQYQAAPSWFRAYPQHTKMKASLVVQALSPESLFPTLLCTANDLQQNHSHPAQQHALPDHLFAVRSTVTQQSLLTNSQEAALTSGTLKVGWGQDGTGGSSQLLRSALPPAHLGAIYRCDI